MPNLKVPEPAEGATSNVTNDAWNVVPLQTNLFAQDEWPVENPRDWDTFSIGEEQSSSDVMSLAWSPPGLARHGRCVLAILTTNNVLSIWQSNSTPKDRSSWERVLVVNHTLTEHYEIHQSKTASGSSSKRHSEQRSRIRAFAWAPKFDESLPLPNQYQRLLAVADDDNVVFIVRIQAPYDVLAVTPSVWQCEVLDTFVVSPHEDEATTTEEAIPFSSYVKARDLVNYLDWSPWYQSRHSDGVQSFIATLCGGRISGQKCYAANPWSSVTASTDGARFPMGGRSILGPLKWIDTSVDSLQPVGPSDASRSSLVIDAANDSGLESELTLYHSQWSHKHQASNGDPLFGDAK